MSTTFEGAGFIALPSWLTTVHTNGIFDEDRLSFWTGFSRSRQVLCQDSEAVLFLGREPLHPAAKANGSDSCASQHGKRSKTGWASHLKVVSLMGSLLHLIHLSLSGSNFSTQ